MRIVVALGGNALLRRGEPLEAAVQQRNARRAAVAVAEIAREHELVVTHGNGPQVGLLALQAAAGAGAGEPAWPLDVLGAESEGMIGYALELELRNALRERSVATVLTLVEVDAADPALASPSKPIGPVYDAAQGERIAAARGWRMVRDGAGLRRAVASPEPRRLLGLEPIRLLVDAGVLVVCAGGGGVPVAAEPGGLRGVEAVVDKDLAAALLASALECDVLLLLTDVAAVYDDFGRADARALRDVTPAVLRARRFEPGTMAPKVEAACRFVEAGGRLAGIGRLEDAAAILAGHAGTRVSAQGAARVDAAPAGAVERGS